MLIWAAFSLCLFTFPLSFPTLWFNPAWWIVIVPFVLTFITFFVPLCVFGFDTKLAEGVYLLTPFAADAQDDLTKSFVSAFNAKYNSTPTQFAADAYDCVYAIYQACKNANITPDMATSDITAAMIKEFTSMQFKGLTGDCTWASNGEVSKSPKAVIISGGVYVSAE